MAVEGHTPEMERHTTDTAVTPVAHVASSKYADCRVTPAPDAGVANVTSSDYSPPAQPETDRTTDDAGGDAEPSPFPPPGARPRYVLLEAPTEYGGRNYRPGVWHCFMSAEKKDRPSEPVNQWICSPLIIKAVTHDRHGGEFGRLLRFKPTRGDWREWAMPMELLAGSGDEMRRELLRQGVEIDPNNRTQLSLYLQAKAPRKSIECATQTGWTGDSFVLPDVVIGPNAARITFQSAEHASNEYCVGGTLEDWRSEVATLATGNPVLLLALSAAFAGPLLKKCHAESGGVHFVGDSSTGKTTAIAAAASVFGPEAYRRSWRTTANGLEAVAALFNDSLLCLDEISEADPREVGACVYALGNGAGKQRASRSGATRPVKRWRCSVLSSGERTIDSAMMEGGKRAKAGMAVRLLDIPVNRAHGAWDNLHGLSGAKFSDTLKTASAKHYGHAGRTFVTRLAFDERDFTTALETLKQAPGFQSAEGQHRRAAQRMAIIGLAGELATEYGITGWEEGEAIEAAITLFATWRDHRGHGPSERRQILESVREFIDRHGGARFSDIKGTKDDVRDRAGWWREDSSGRRLYLFNAGAIREAVGGHDLKHALQHLLELGTLIDCGASEKAKAHRTNEGTRKLYTIDPERLEDPDYAA
jgi:putative DNA primase/helicase